MHKLAVKLEGIERRKRSIGLLHIAAGCFIIAKAVDYLFYFDYKQWLVPLFAFIVVLISLVYGFFRKKVDPEARFNHWVRLLQVAAFLLLGINFFLIGRQLDGSIVFFWTLVCCFLLVAERKVFTEMQLQFGTGGVTVPGYISNHTIGWNAVTTVVARPDYITIFQKNNKYLQLELLHHEPTNHLEKINSYCVQQIQGTTNTTI